LRLAKIGKACQQIKLPPPIHWNHGVRGRIPARSLDLKYLFVKYSGIRTYDLRLRSR
jgi:hypothetical protein